MTDGIANQPDEVQSEQATELELLHGQLEQLETQRSDYEAQVVALRSNLTQAVGKYRSKLLAGSPEMPQELVKGETVDELDASFEAARKVVERIKERLETQKSSEMIPAGAPARGLPDLSALSPLEKIAYGLARR